MGCDLINDPVYSSSASVSNVLNELRHLDKKYKLSGKGEEHMSKLKNASLCAKFEVKQLTLYLTLYPCGPREKLLVAKAAEALATEAFAAARDQRVDMWKQERDVILRRESLKIAEKESLKIDKR